MVIIISIIEVTCLKIFTAQIGFKPCWLNKTRNIPRQICLDFSTCGDCVKHWHILNLLAYEYQVRKYFD